MVGSEDISCWFGRLTKACNGQRDGLQVPALLEAFSKIDNPVLREEIIIMIEIISRDPSIIQRKLREAALALN